MIYLGRGPKILYRILISKWAPSMVTTVNMCICFLAFQISKLRFALFETGSLYIACLPRLTWNLQRSASLSPILGFKTCTKDFWTPCPVPFVYSTESPQIRVLRAAFLWAQLVPIPPTSFNVKFCQSNIIKNIPLQFQIQIPRKESSSVTDRFHRLRLGSGGMVLTLPVTRLFEVKDKHSRNPSALHLYTKQEAGAQLYCERSLQ